MLDDEKVLKLIVKLTRLTVEGRLIWSISEQPKGYVSEGSLLSQVYEANVEGVGLRIFEEAKEWVEWSLISPDGDKYPLSRPRFNRDASVVMVFVDKNGYSDAVFNDTIGLRQLFNTIRNKVSGLESKIDSILSA